MTAESNKELLWQFFRALEARDTAALEHCVEVPGVMTHMTGSSARRDDPTDNVRPGRATVDGRRSTANNLTEAAPAVLTSLTASA